MPVGDRGGTAGLVELRRPSHGRPARLSRLIRQQLARRALALRRFVAGAERKRQAPGRAPRFSLGGPSPSFDELERILFDAEVMRQIEATPRAPLLRRGPVAPDLSPVAERFGWRRRRRPARVYDVLAFGLDLDVLELRLAELWDVVDVFVVAESERGFGGVPKPLHLRRNWDRFAPFHAKLVHLVLDSAPLDALHPTRRRWQTDWRGEDAQRAGLWAHVRRMGIESDALLIAGDVDELLPPAVIRLLSHHECPLPMRFALPAFRYDFGWRDSEAPGNITVVSPESFAHLDRHPPDFRTLEARLFAARGAAHLTSFFQPAALLAKFALATDWDAGLEPFLRNDHGEAEEMIRRGTWFGRPLAPYDPDADPDGMVPESARLNRARYPHFWPPA